MKPDEALAAENQVLRRERDDARRWAAAWKASARANHDAYQDAQLNFQESQRQYNAQQKRACEAEAELETVQAEGVDAWKLVPRIEQQIRADERERCAGIAGKRAGVYAHDLGLLESTIIRHRQWEAEWIAAAIREAVE